MPEQLNIIINASNNTDPAFQGVQRNLQNLGIWVSQGGKETFQAVDATQQMTQASKDAINPLGALAAGWSKVMAVTAGVVAATYTVKKVIDFAEEGAQIGSLKVASSQLAQTYGANMTQIVSAVQKASLGTISQYDAMKAGSAAMTMGVSTDANVIANLMQIAMLRARAFGLDTADAFDRIITGIGRNSSRFLYELGFNIKGASSSGELMNAVLDQGNKEIKAQGGVVADVSTAYQRAGANIKDFTDNLKENLTFGLQPLVASTKEVITQDEGRAKDAITGLTGDYKDYTAGLTGAAHAQGEWINSNGDLVKRFANVDAITGQVTWTEKLIQANYRLSESQFNMKQTYGRVLNSLSDFSIAQQGLLGNTAELGNYVNTVALQAALQGDLTKIQDKYVAGLADAHKNVTKLGAAYENMNKDIKAYAFNMVTSNLTMDENGQFIYNAALAYGQMTKNEYDAAQAGAELSKYIKDNNLTWAQAKPLIDGYNASLAKLMAGGTADYFIYIHEIASGAGAGYTPSLTPGGRPVLGKGSSAGGGQSVDNPRPSTGNKILKQYGGTVQGGEAYIVGEKRPEIFIPDSNGRINPSTSGFNGGAPVTINFTYAPIVSTASRREALEVMAPVIEDVIKSRLQVRIL